MSAQGDARGPDDPAAGSSTGPTAAEMREALWADVVGQPRVVQALRTAATDPVQAYLFVGPEGSGKRALATAFAAEVVSRGLDEQAARRAARLVGAMAHPSVHLIEREGPFISRAAAMEVVRAASRAPTEGSVQVFVLDEFHLVREAAPTLLKAIEEPESATMFLVLAEEITEDLVTIASRCAQYTLGPVAQDAIRDRLSAEGIEPDAAAEAARGAGGNLRRARLLANDPELVRRRSLWQEAPGRLDGTGATLCEVTDELLASVDGVLEPLRAVHETEVRAFEETVEMTGDAARGPRKVMEDRHKREIRRLRSDELLSGAAALLSEYRSAALAGRDGSSAAFATASEAVDGFTEAIRWNAGEPLALRALMLALPDRVAGSGG